MKQYRLGFFNIARLPYQSKMTAPPRGNYVKSYFIFFLAIGVLACSAHASWFSQGVSAVTKPVEKAVQWAGKQSGVTPTNKNLNEAAEETKNTNKKLQNTVKEVTPVIVDTAGSIKRTSDGVSELVRLLEWPLFALVIAFILWMSGKAVAAWKALPLTPKAVSKSERRTGSVENSWRRKARKRPFPLTRAAATSHH